MNTNWSLVHTGSVPGSVVQRTARRGLCVGSRARGASRCGRAFTLVELLVITLIVAFGVLMLVPALARTRVNSPAFQCLNNAKQLVMAWIMYADDNNGVLAPNSGYSSPAFGSPGPAWVAGYLDFSNDNTDNTNTLMLVDHNRYTNGAYLGPYVSSAAIFKCPADRSTAMEGGVQLPRVRSVSINGYLNTIDPGNRPGTHLILGARHNIRSPVNMFVTVDEHEGSINDGWFATDPDALYQVVDFPAFYHANAGGFSFADGHSEIHKWLDRRTMPIVPAGQLLTLNVNLGGDKDVLWIAQHSAGLTKYP
jgi:hypothetical protein